MILLNLDRLPRLFEAVRALSTLRRQEEELKKRLQCGLGRAQLLEALTFLGPQPAPSWDDRVVEWLAWFSDCVGRRGPGPRSQNATAGVECGYEDGRHPHADDRVVLRAGHRRR